MNASQPTVGMIAGNGIYPENFVRGARRAGVGRLVAAAFHNETAPDLETKVDSMEWFRVGQLGKMLRFFKKQEVCQAVMVGQIAPKNLFDLRPDMRTLILLGKLKTRNAESIFAAIGDELAADGIELLPATTYLEDQLASKGHLAGPEPSRRAEDEIAYGLHIAKEVSRLDIGQTVVVKKGTVLAVEAFEGTNEAVARGGALGRGEATMVKVSKPNQDFRFDVPVIGPDTILNAAQAGIALIAVEAGATLMLDRERVVELCQEHGVTLMGC